MLHYEQLTAIIDIIFGKKRKLEGLEIGTNTGTMERTLLEAFPNLFMHGIDIQDHHLDNWKHPRLRFIVGESDQCLDKFKKEQLDFVYIDACHTYEQCKKDILNYAPFIKKDGIIAGHDYVLTPNNENEGVRFAVDELFEADKIHFGEDLVWWVFRRDIKWL